MNDSHLPKHERQSWQPSLGAMLVSVVVMFNVLNIFLFFGFQLGALIAASIVFGGAAAIIGKLVAKLIGFHDPLLIILPAGVGGAVRAKPLFSSRVRGDLTTRCSSRCLSVWP